MPKSCGTLKTIRNKQNQDSFFKSTQTEKGFNLMMCLNKNNHQTKYPKKEQEWNGQFVESFMRNAIVI